MPPSDFYILSAFSSVVFPEPWGGGRDGLLRTKDISLNKLTVPSHPFSVFPPDLHWCDSVIVYITDCCIRATKQTNHNRPWYSTDNNNNNIEESTYRAAQFSSDGLMQVICNDKVEMFIGVNN